MPQMPETAVDAEGKKEAYLHLAAEERNAKGQFTHLYRGGPGRERGSQNFSKVLHRAAPKLAKAYVKAALKGNSATLVDSRKIFLPIDSDAASSTLAMTQIDIVAELQRRGVMIPSVADDPTDSPRPTPTLTSTLNGSDAA